MRAPALAALAALLAAPDAGAAERLWLRLEARFVCGGLRPQVLELLEGAAAELPVPAGCPGAGQALQVELACPKGRCAGRLLRGDEVVATLEERRQALVVTTPSPAGPAAQLALAIVRRDRVAVDEARLGEPVALTLTEPSRKLSVLLPLRPGQPSTVGLDEVRLTLEVRWVDAAHLRLLASTPRPARWSLPLVPGEAVQLPCASLGLSGACDVSLVVDRSR